MTTEPEFTPDEILAEAVRLHETECWDGCPRIPLGPSSSWYEYGEISLRLKGELAQR